LQEAQEAEEMERKRKRKPKFQQVYTSCPDGLAIRFELDPSSLGRLQLTLIFVAKYFFTRLILIKIRKINLFTLSCKGTQLHLNID